MPGVQSSPLNWAAVGPAENWTINQIELLTSLFLQYPIIEWDQPKIELLSELNYYPVLN